MTKENIVAATTLSVACVAMLAFMVTTSVNCSRAAEAQRSAQLKREAARIKAEAEIIKQQEAAEKLERDRINALKPKNLHPVNERFWDQIVAYGLDPSVPYPDFPLVIVETPTARGRDGINYFEGKVRNFSDKHLNGLSLTYDYYDANGSKIGTVRDFTERLGPGETWSFQAVGLFPGLLRSTRGPYFGLVSFE